MAVYCLLVMHESKGIYCYWKQNYWVSKKSCKVLWTGVDFVRVVQTKGRDSMALSNDSESQNIIF